MAKISSPLPLQNLPLFQVGISSFIAWIIFPNRSIRYPGCADPASSKGGICFTLLWIHNKTNYKMGNILYAIAVILVILWLIGFLGYAAGGLIHVLLVLAIIAILVNVIGGNRSRI
jgi:hypothetical protein